mmetsp:Transcript_41092/g.102650  ORF Transcript_41092/g.102650 Transcript_41092/m.102650 type:complete len:82 (-) Transcript_41092:91-336(-)
MQPLREVGFTVQAIETARVPILTCTLKQPDANGNGGGSGNGGEAGGREVKVDISVGPTSTTADYYGRTQSWTLALQHWGWP